MRAHLDEQAKELDDSVRQALVLANGVPMQALRAAIIANTFLIEENEQLRQQVSTGFERGLVRKPAVKKTVDGKR